MDPTDRSLYTQEIEATRRALKSSLKHLRGATQDSLPSYIFEYIFRRVYPADRLFQSFLSEISIVYLIVSTVYRYGTFLYFLCKQRYFYFVNQMFFS